MLQYGMCWFLKLCAWHLSAFSLISPYFCKEYGTQRVEQHEPLTLASPPDSHLGHAMQLGFGDGEGATPICFTPESGQKFRRVHPDTDYKSSSTSALSGCAGLTQSTNDSIYLDKDRLDSL